MSVIRFGVSLEDDLLRSFDKSIVEMGYGNRSEAIRDLIRRRLVEDRIESEDGEAVASLTLLFDHEQRELSEHLAEAGHAHHTRVLSTLHVHLDQRLCLEVQVLQGEPSELRQYADQVTGLRGVKHGELVLTSAGLWREHKHAHDHGAERFPASAGRHRHEGGER